MFAGARRRSMRCASQSGYLGLTLTHLGGGARASRVVRGWLLLAGSSTRAGESETRIRWPVHPFDS